MIHKYIMISLQIGIKLTNFRTIIILNRFHRHRSNDKYSNYRTGRPYTRSGAKAFFSIKSPWKKLFQISQISRLFVTIPIKREFVISPSIHQLHDERKGGRVEEEEEREEGEGWKKRQKRRRARSAWSRAGRRGRREAKERRRQRTRM